MGDASKMKDQIKEVRDKLANKDSMDPEEIKKTVNELQQQSLKLFEMAYKKMASERSGGASRSAKTRKKRSSEVNDTSVMVAVFYVNRWRAKPFSLPSVDLCPRGKRPLQFILHNQPNNLLIEVRWPGFILSTNR